MELSPHSMHVRSINTAKPKTRLVILGQEAVEFKSHDRVIRDSRLWTRYMEESSRCRGKAYFDDGLVRLEDLSADGRLTDRFDPLSIHFLCCEGDKVVGCMRVFHLNVNGSLREGYLEHVFRSVKLDHHLEVYRKRLAECHSGRQSILDFSRFAVDENYRLFRNIHSKVGLSVLASAHFFMLANDVKHLFVTRGNKYKTKDIYERIGCKIVKDFNGEPLEPFWKYGDLNDLMHMALEDFTDFFVKLAQSIQQDYEMAEVILPSERL